LIASQLSFTTAIPHLAKIIAAEIKDKTRILAEHPLIGRAVEGRPEIRQLVLEVANARYVFCYAFDGTRLVMLRVFHTREARD
jgi:plasmid stabilization system protein ParE